MTKKIFALLLAAAMLLALAACSGNNTGSNDTQNDAVSDNTQNDSADNTVTDDTADNSQNDAADDMQDDAAADDTQNDTDGDTAGEEKVPVLNRDDFTLKNVGDSFRLEVENLPDGAAVAWSISDEAVATVAEDGTVTAVAHGTATVTAAFGDGGSGLTCIVRVTAQSESAGGKDLTTFYNNVISNYELPSMMLLEDEELLDNFFPGLTAVQCNQRNVYFNMMSVNNGEMALAEAASVADVEAVTAAFQARVDYMIDNSMFYAESNAIWTNNTRVVSVGNYVLMVASPHCDAIVNDFQAFVK